MVIRERGCLRRFVSIMPPYLDHDPLTDRNPRPRYAVESDDEDDLKGTDGYFDVFSFESALEIEKHLPLILASGSAGIFLSSLLASRAHSAPTGVYAISTEANRNSHFKRIGYVAQQKGKYTILISESGPPQIVLPLPRMHPYAQWVIDKFQPSRWELKNTPFIVSRRSRLRQSLNPRHLLPLNLCLTNSPKISSRSARSIPPYFLQQNYGDNRKVDPNLRTIHPPLP